jgi:hypothetical protein
LRLAWSVVDDSGGSVLEKLSGHVGDGRSGNGETDRHRGAEKGSGQPRKRFVGRRSATARSYPTGAEDQPSIR